MSFALNYGSPLDALQHDIYRAKTITPGLVENIVARSCPRFKAQHPGTKAKVSRLIESGAFVDATVALIELELPGWKLRRLLWNDDIWHCLLSKEPALPIELGEAAVGIHTVLPLAILGAFVEARSFLLAARENRSGFIPQVQLADGHALCCDNFS
jgi:hypothetical protein